MTHLVHATLTGGPRAMRTAHALARKVFAILCTIILSPRKLLTDLIFKTAHARCLVSPQGLQVADAPADQRGTRAPVRAERADQALLLMAKPSPLPVASVLLAGAHAQ